MGRQQQYAVIRSNAERTALLSFTNTGAAGARQLQRAHMLRLASEGTRAREMAQALHPALQTGRNIRKK